MDLNAVCDGIAAAVTSAAVTVNGQRVTATGFMPEAVAEPHFFCAETTINYHKTHGGLVEVLLTCRLMVSRADDKSGQEKARAVLAATGSNSIPAAIEAARGAPGQAALSGACQDLVLQRVQGPRYYQIGQVEYLGLEFVIFVMG